MLEIGKVHWMQASRRAPMLLPETMAESKILEIELGLLKMKSED